MSFNKVKLIHIDENNYSQRLDNYLVKTLKGVPKSKIYNIIRRGEVRVNKGRKKPEYKLELGDIIRIPPIRVTNNKPKQITSSLEKLINDNIIYEDQAILAINKPSGLAVHSGSGITTGLIEAIKTQQPNYELVHRIDRATSGIVLIAKKRSILKELQAQLINNQIKKFYTAILVNKWAKKKYIIDAPLSINNNKTIVSLDGKEALSIFNPIRNFTQSNIDLCLTEIEIKTGRNHQIRVHSNHAKHPILGDEKYGDFLINKKLKTRRMYLHNSKMVFINPLNNKPQTIISSHNFDLINDK